jgi:hypothetical protein
MLRATTHSQQWSDRKQQRKQEREYGLQKMNEYLFLKNEQARLDKERQLEQEQ